MFVRSLYNYDREAVSNETGLKCEDVSRAKQSFAEECDINTIVRRFGLTGHVPVGVRMPTYADYANLPDYHSAMNAIAQAREAFDAMPSSVRARFQNDPGLFVDFCSDAKNRDEAVKLGLVLPQAGALANQAIPTVRNDPGASGAAPAASPSAGSAPPSGTVQ